MSTLEVGPSSVADAQSAVFRVIDKYGRWRYDVPKRLMDLSLALTVLMISAPVLVIAVALVRATSSGPAIFRQQRVGRNGAPFTILKLRSMYTDADHSQQRAFNEAELKGELDDIDEYTLSEDPRVTPIGRLIRKISVDELPQLWNVVRGDMSLVGPRPSCDWEVELYDPRFQGRLAVQPGITGLWQVTGRRTIDMQGMLELDLEYAEQRSLRLDVEILARTVPAVLKGTGAA